MALEDHGVEMAAGGDITVAGDIVGRDKIVNIYTYYNLPQPKARLPAALPVTNEWPVFKGEFVGRASELAELEQQLTALDGVIIWGPAGVGKTQLALHLAQAYAGRQSLRCAYIDLQGTSREPLSAAHAMARILAQVRRMPIASIGDNLMAGHYRGQLSKTPAVLVLDNAGGEAQLEALWPPRGCKVIVTSRQQIVRDRLHTRRLQAFTPAEARAFLRQFRYAGTAYARRIGRYAAQIADLCGGLPFALEKASAAFAKLAPHETPAGWVKDFASPPVRLKRTGVEAERALQASAAQLSPVEQASWHMLALFPIAFDVAQAQMLFGMETAEVGELLHKLWQHSLIEHAGGSRYRLHELTRLYAEQQLTDVDRRLAEHNLVAGLIDRRQRYNRAKFLAECWLSSRWRPPRLEAELTQSLREMLMAPRLRLSERRTAAFRLTRLRWLDRLTDEEMAVGLDLIGRFVTHPDNLAYLSEAITQALQHDLSRQQQAILRVHRAAKLGAMGRFEQAEADYRQALGWLEGFHRQRAQAYLGLGNIALFRAQSAPTPRRRAALLQQAVRRYREGERITRSAEPDVILRVTLYGHLSFAHACLSQWPQARRMCRTAFRILDQGKGRLAQADYMHYYIWTLEKSSLVSELEGEAWKARGDAARARRQYAAALKEARRALTLLRRPGHFEAEALIAANNNAGRFLWQVQELAGGVGPAMAAQACAYWREAEETAGRLGLEEYVAEAQSYLRQHCPEGGA